MRLMKLVIFVLAISGGECRYRILNKETAQKRDNKLDWLAESAVSTLLSCYEKKVDTIGALGITEPILYELLMTKQPLPVKLFDDDSLEETRLRPRPHKLHLFVVEAPSSIRRFQRLLSKALASQYEGQMATYLIIDWPSEKSQKSCLDAVNYLWMTWTMSILNAFYVCVDKLDGKVLVFSYNPYLSQAPAPWHLNNTYQPRVNDQPPWSLFVREYQPGDERICNNLDFIKNHDIGGYKVRCFIDTDRPFSEWTTHHAEEKFFNSNDPNSVYLRYLLKSIKATPDLYLYGRIGGKWVAWNPSRKVAARFPDDLEISQRVGSSALKSERLTTTYPIVIMNLAVLTHHAGSKSQLDKLLGVFDKRTRFGLCIVILTTLLFFTFCMGQSLGTAFMNVMRIISNTGLLREPNRNAPRLYLAGVFILVVTIFGTYQGLLAALLTKPSPLPEIETLEDLANSDHRIFVTETFVKFFQDPRFNGRIVPQVVQEFSCRDPELENPSVACVDVRFNVIQYAIFLKRHVSRDDIVPQYTVFILRPYWVHEKRFNEIISLTAASGLDLCFYEKNLLRKVEKARQMEELERDRPVVIKLGDLGFAFAFLGIGLSLATIVLVIEIAMNRAGFR